jgi:hypothetical protein
LHDCLQAEGLEELVVFGLGKTAPIYTAGDDFTEVPVWFLVIFFVFILGLGCLELLGNCEVC